MTGQPAAGPLLETAFRVWRDRFTLWAAIMIPSAIVTVVTTLLTAGLLEPDELIALEGDPAALLSLLPRLVTTLAIAFVGSWFMQIASLACVTLAWDAQGESGPRGAVQAWRRLRPHVGGVLALATALFALLILLPLLLCGLAASVMLTLGMAVSSGGQLAWLVVAMGSAMTGTAVALVCALLIGARVAVSVPALIHGSAGAASSLRESARITQGRQWVVFLVCFLALLASSLATLALQTPLAVAGWLVGGQGPVLRTLSALVAGVSVTLVGALPGIAMTLLESSLRNAPHVGGGSPLGQAGGVYNREHEN